MYHTITLKDLRPQLPRLINDVITKLYRYIVSKRGEPVAVLLSLEDYESMIETLNETGDREGLRRIKQGMAQAKKGQTVRWQDVKNKMGL